MRKLKPRFRFGPVATGFVLLIVAAGCAEEQQTVTAPQDALMDRAQSAGSNFRLIDLPPAFQIEKLVDGLSFTTQMAFDSRGQLYVNEAGGGFQSEQFRPPRILRIDLQTGEKHEVINLTGLVVPPVVGLAWDDGWLYFTHRDNDNTGALSRVRDDGSGLQKLLTGFVSAQAEHFMNGVEVRNGWVYFGVGQAGNAAVLGPDVAPFVKSDPGVRPLPCRNLVMRGHNFEGPDFRTPDPDDMVLTGPYARFGEVTRRGQTIQGMKKCGGAVHRFDPNSPEATLQMVADGIRQPLALAFHWANADLFIAENGYDVRGLRPVQDEFDATLRINPNAPGRWYGFPDFSAAREPLTLDKFEVPDRLQAPVVLVREDGSRQTLGKFLDFVIDHAASGLSAPDRSLVAGLHQKHSSPSGIDVAPRDWGELAGDLFVAEWGDLTPPTNPLLTDFRAGIRIVRIDPNAPQTRAQPFVQNRQQATASEMGAQGEALERPFDVKFGPDMDRPGQRRGHSEQAMYISDYGVVKIDFSSAPPYRYVPNTGAIWRVTRRGAFGKGNAPPPAAQAPKGKSSKSR